MKQGTLVYDHATDRYDIRFDLDCYYGGLHCGECFDVMVRGKWKPTRIEMAADWYLGRHPHGRFAGIEGEDVKTFLKEVLLPLLIALCLAAFFKPVYMADGVCDYFLMWLCVGFPFGIRRMCLWLVPFGYGISGTVGIFALNIIIGGLIGGLALIVGLLLGIIHTIREII